MIYFTADTHFRHYNILKYCNRPFTLIEEMDNVFIDNINRVVRPEDTLYHLGDFAFGRENDIIGIRSRINCRNIILIYGNHDKTIRQMHFAVKRLFFRDCHELLEIKIGGQSITLCHYAMKVWNKSYYGAWMLYGHSHGSLPDDPNSLSIDCGVDCHNYSPISFSQVHDIMSKKTWKAIDHHDCK